MTAQLVLVVVFGALIGSFLNVCIYRMPRGLSIVSPGSRCPSCGAAVKPYDNIPIISYLILAGRCRGCDSPISLRYPLIELLNALLYAAAVWRFGFGWSTPVLFVFLSALIVITFIDLDFQIIPDAITIPGTFISLALAFLVMPDPFERNSLMTFTGSLIGLAVGGGTFYLIAVLSRGGMGGGDIKMMAMVGALLGWKAVLLTTFLGSLLGSVIGLFLVAFRGKGRKTKVPFGPFLALGALVTLFFGQEVLDLYLRR